MMSIAFSDPVYGEVCFAAPLLRDLYQADAVQRLNHIYQGGITAFIKPERQTTRLDHSRGVAAVLQRLGAGIVEQAAGLIHDVPHTAFSHVVDFVFPNADHTYHEDHRERVIEDSALPQILNAHHLDWRMVTEAENFTLLEQPLPLLCADRLDYFLRDGIVDVGTFSQADGERLLHHLQVVEGIITVDDITVARWLGRQFMRLDDICWCSIQEVGWYAVMAQALQAAIVHGVIAEEDFAGVDRDIMAKLETASVPDINRWLELLRPDVDFVRVRPDAAHDLVALPKVRAIDPPVIINHTTRRLSQIDADFAQQRDRYVAEKTGIWHLKILA